MTPNLAIGHVRVMAHLPAAPASAEEKQAFLYLAGEAMQEIAREFEVTERRFRLNLSSGIRVYKIPSEILFMPKVFFNDAELPRSSEILLEG